MGDRAGTNNLYIMKRATSIISAFCLGLFISIGILACAVDDYATPNANNPSSDLQLCKMEINDYDGSDYTHVNITYGSDGRISSMLFTEYEQGGPEFPSVYNEYKVNILYNQNKIIFSFAEQDVDFTFNNELHYYSAETINNQVFNCITLRNWKQSYF